MGYYEGLILSALQYICCFCCCCHFGSLSMCHLNYEACICAIIYFLQINIHMYTKRCRLLQVLKIYCCTKQTNHCGKKMIQKKRNGECLPSKQLCRCSFIYFVNLYYFFPILAWIRLSGEPPSSWTSTQAD